MRNESSEILVALVDNTGKITGYAEKMLAHLRGDLHLAFSLMIIRRNKHYVEYLLQRRALHKYHSGGLWANTCCSHPLPEENIQDAARRRVSEELGISASLSMSSIGQIQYKYQLDNNMIEHELDKILVTEVESVHWQQNSDEVMEVRWWSEKEVLQQLLNKPDIFAAWFPKVFEHTRHNLPQQMVSVCVVPQAN
ncbi:MAG: isopentenyl-diphosphate delta-isomerase [Paraglaciecola sp.]|jgi:isopentenyl-diphosphate delta-isomerase